MKDYKENLVIGQLIGDALRARYEFKNGKKIKSENNSDIKTSNCGILNPNTAIIQSTPYFSYFLEIELIHN